MGKTYELRTYVVGDGKLKSLVDRFTQHALRLFERHGIQSIGYWTEQVDQQPTKLLYLVAHESRQAADENWKRFQADPEWVSVFSESNANGKLVVGFERRYLQPLEFSPLA
jgi:hypothetical protein